jgi:hypothetical protein
LYISEDYRDVVIFVKVKAIHENDPPFSRASDMS